MSNRRPLIAGNWKMFKTSEEAAATAKEIVHLVQDVNNADVLISPPFTSISLVREIIRESSVLLAAQNLHWEKEGAFTGEISPAMLVSAGCTHVIIGHSERRAYFGETDETVNKKINAAILNNLIPIFCVGESDEERELNKTFSVLDKQVENGLKGLALTDAADIVLAYEPVWAIGTGKTATGDQAQEVHAYLRGLLEKKYGASFADSLRILYGGSVKPNNIASLMEMPDIDGALIGGASLDPGTFSKIASFK